MLWIRNDLMRIHLYPDPDRIQGFDDQKLKKNCNTFLSFWIENCNLLYLGFHLVGHFPLLDADPDPATQINADPCGSGSTTLRLTPDKLTQQAWSSNLAKSTRTLGRRSSQSAPKRARAETAAARTVAHSSSTRL
jgi:hypothetical protein